MSDIRPSTRSAPHASTRERQSFDAELASRPLSTFIGRDREIATAIALLQRADVRLVTITGTGGVGKTRLALRIAETYDAIADDGAVFVPLAAVRDPDMVLPTVAQHLRVPDAPGQPLPARLRAFLGNRELLLVLDNLEHLLDAVPALVDLLAACPRLTILSTCRTHLNISGEHLMPLAPLRADEGRALFLERVRALMPEFALTDDTPAVIDAICARLDGLPLAIELAASRAPALPLRALLTRLERRLDLLTNGPRDAPLRLRGMRDAIAWSHDLLPPEQQILFRRLGVFVGGFTLVAAEAIAGDGIDVFEGMAALVGANLVIPAEGVADEPRYTMLETIREFALEQLEVAGELPTMRARHADYHRALAEDSLPLYDGPDIRVASDRVDIELDNCRAAMSWALEHHAAETGLRLAGALWRIWWFAQATAGKPWRDRVTEGLSWIERMLPMRDGLPVEAMTEALAGGGALAVILGNFDRAHEMSSELVERARAEAYPYGEYWGLGARGTAAEAQGDVDAARRYFEAALPLIPAMRNPENHAAVALHALGALALRAGDLEAASRHLEEALRLSYGTGNRWMTAESAADLGRALRQQGALHPAAAMLRESLVAFSEQRDLFEIHAGLAELARLALAIGQPDRATRLLGAAMGFPRHDDRETDVASAIQETRARISEAVWVTETDTGKQMAWDEVLAEIDALIDDLTGGSGQRRRRPSQPVATASAAARSRCCDWSRRGAPAARLPRRFP